MAGRTKNLTNAGKGRPKGSLNKRTKHLKEKLEEWGCNPAQILADFANGTATDKDGNPIEVDDALRAQCARDLMPYAFPRLTASQIDVALSNMPSVKVVYEAPEDSAE